jgi:predicted alpha/beta superfamily hydrolase
MVDGKVLMDPGEIIDAQIATYRDRPPDNLLSLSEFGVRGVRGKVRRIEISGHTVDFWGPKNPTHVLIAHDGDEMFDRKATSSRQTFKLAEISQRVALKRNLQPPLLIGIFHSKSNEDPKGRHKDLFPEKFRNEAAADQYRDLELRGDSYQRKIALEILPTILDLLKAQIAMNRTAIFGASMGGLSALYGMASYPNVYGTGLIFSPHWIIGGNELVKNLIDSLPDPTHHRLWLSRGTTGLDALYEPFQKLAIENALGNGWIQGNNFHHEVFRRTGHNQRSWRSYLAKAINFWLSESE